MRVGDKVRLLEQSETFNKKHLTKWSKKVYIIKGYDGIDLLKHITEDQKHGNSIICTFSIEKT